MATDRQRQRNMQSLYEETGIDLAACVEAAYEAGRLQGASETEARFAEIAGQTARETTRRLRQTISSQAANAAKLVKITQHMGRLLMAEHLLIRSRWLARMTAAAKESQDAGLLIRLRRIAAECNLRVIGGKTRRRS